VQNLAEFDCYNKAFHYLANRLSRDQLLHPFLDEATVEPLQGVQCWIAGMQIAKSNQKTQMANAEGVDVAALLQGLTMAVGRPLAAPPGADSDASTTAAVPLAVAEPDIFPCLLATVGSGVGFFKVRRSIVV
jgi:hypothetical protein